MKCIDLSTPPLTTPPRSTPPPPAISAQIWRAGAGRPEFGQAPAWRRSRLRVEWPGAAPRGGGRGAGGQGTVVAPAGRRRCRTGGFTAQICCEAAVLASWGVRGWAGWAGCGGGGHRGGPCRVEQHAGGGREGRARAGVVATGASRPDGFQGGGCQSRTDAVHPGGCRRCVCKASEGWRLHITPLLHTPSPTTLPSAAHAQSAPAPGRGGGSPLCPCAACPSFLSPWLKKHSARHTWTAGPWCGREGREERGEKNKRERDGAARLGGEKKSDPRSASTAPLRLHPLSSRRHARSRRRRPAPCPGSRCCSL